MGNGSEENMKPRLVKDDQGHQYELKGKIGEGGQGAVYRTQHPRVLVKLSKPLSPEVKQHTEDHLKWLRRQPLDTLHIASPLALIANSTWAGYVIELMDGLIPLSNLLENTLNKGMGGFLETGGLLRRLKLMGKLARVIAQVHSRGLAYGDISPDNIYISDDLSYSEVWLIDCDNICYHSRSSEAGVYTPDYGAPEIVQGVSGINSYTDSWSFAVIAYQLMTMKHPLKGDMVNDGDPEMEKSALRGELPWIGHPENNSNACSTGIPDEYIFGSGKKIFKMMDQCFRDGLSNPEERPTMVAWAEAFEEATLAIMFCENEECGSSFYFNTDQKCTFCDYQQQQTKAYLLNEYIWFPDDALPEDGNPQKDRWLRTGRFLVLQAGQEESHLKKEQDDYSFSQDDTLPLCKLKIDDNGIWIKPGSEVEVKLQNGSKVESIRRKHQLKTEFQKNQDWYLHLGGFDITHPVWRFRW